MMGTRAVAIIALLALGGCGGEQHVELKQWIDEQGRTITPPRVEPLPEVKPFEVFAYQADKEGLPDPFKPRNIEPPKQASGGGVRPDLNRRKEPLEAYPLENLKMVGTLAQHKEVFALVKTPDNNLFRVKRGNFLGQNFGLITDVTEAEVKLKEIVQDSGGDWTERVSALQLQDEQEVARK